ncbi:MAG TPA: hypothetical protein VE779_08015 [Candidatus Angelobacter sp.]|nr:hypothetical protein [Candidatus Angelobacter sp.]
MTDQKKKCWREKVTAEITLTHLQEFAQEVGTNFNQAQLATFLNQNGRAQGLWNHMMQAGEQYIKLALRPEVVVLPPTQPSVAHTATIQ